MDYVKIPQNVQIEDKLIGPLSLRQIIIIAIGGGMSYAFYAVIEKSMGVVPIYAHALIWWPAIILTAIAVVRINDISLTRYMLLILESSLKPKIRIWQPRKGVLSLPPKVTEKKAKKKAKGEDSSDAVKNKKSDVRLEELSVLLDREGKEQLSVSATSSP
jgi:hypothetical protein